MKRAMLAFVAMLVLGGAAWGIDYTVVTNNARWGLVSTWDNGTSVPNSASANVYLRKSLTDSSTSEAPYNYLVGQLIQDNTTATFTVGVSNSTNPNTTTITADDSAGKTGNIMFKAGTLYVYQMNLTLNAHGNVFIGNGFTGSSARTITFNMYGNNKYFKWDGTQYFATQNINIYGQGVWDNASAIGTSNWQMNSTLDVKPGGSIGTYPGVTSTWLVRRLVLEGGQSNLPAVLSPVDFWYTAQRATDNNVQSLVLAGGVTYPRDVRIGHGYWGSANAKNPYYTWQFKGGDITVGRDLLLKPNGSYTGGEYWLSTLENGTATSRNLTVFEDLKVADTTNAPYNDFYGVKGNASTIRIGRDLIVKDNGTLQMGTGTWYVGRDFRLTVNASTAKWAWTRNNWSGGTATVVCDGNGTTRHIAAQVLQLYGDCGITINNLIVNNPGGTVSLNNGAGGALRLSGNLEIDCGTFTGNKQVIMFNGPSHTITNYVNPSTYQFDDNINLLTNTTVLCLGSDITIKTGDNLNMASGSVIYLSGHTLVADGYTYNGLLFGSSWTNDGGTIYALSNVPEPATLVTVGTAALAVLARLRRRRVS